jgi:UDP-N-acetylmuramoyl-L-alanyl-D-glutamate--2,6-diaminopimelate ligase
MGGIAARSADVAVLTSDNPRSEAPEAILAEIESGIGNASTRVAARELAEPGARGYLVEADRERAIRIAIGLAEPADVVVIAGKGHEDYQEVAGVRRPFDDRAVAAAILGAA